MAWMFSASNNDKFDKFNGDISKWDTSNVANMESMFRWNQSFDCSGNNINTSVQERPIDKNNPDGEKEVSCLGCV